MAVLTALIFINCAMAESSAQGIERFKVISGQRSLSEDTVIRAHELFVADGSIITTNGYKLVIQALDRMIIDGSATIQSFPKSNISENPRPNDGVGAPGTHGVSYNRGPGTHGRGRGTNGRNGGHAGNGGRGPDGTNGRNADVIILKVGNEIEGHLEILNRGENGQSGGKGGSGGNGGNGEQGGPSTTRKIFGACTCAAGPASGGSGGNGGAGGQGGKGGNGGRGGIIYIDLPENEQLDGKATVAGGVGGAAGPGGTPGIGGAVGFGGRGSCGCEGRESQRKGHPPGQSGTPGRQSLFAGRAGLDGKFIRGLINEDELNRILNR
jgi:hypothetical protein